MISAVSQFDLSIMHATFHRAYISWHGSRYSIRRYYRRFIRRRHRWGIVPPLKRPFAADSFHPRWFQRLLCSRARKTYPRAHARHSPENSNEKLLIIIHVM